MKAAWTGCGCAAVPSPSSVTILLLPIEESGVTQDRTASPSTCTVALRFFTSIAKSP